MGSPSIYKPHTHFELVKTGSPNLYKPQTRLTVFEMDSQSFYMSPTCFVRVKTHSPHYTTLLRALRWSKMTL